MADQQNYPVIPGSETVGCGVNVIGAVYSTTTAPVGGLRNRIYDLGSLADATQWTFAATGTVYALPPGLTTAGGSGQFRADAGQSSSEFAETFTVSAGVSGSYEGFSAQLSATYSSTYLNDQEFAYAYVVQDGVTWRAVLKEDVATLNANFVKAVNFLPDTFDKADPNNALLFYDFFDVWGTHYVRQAAVGGRLYYYAAVEQSYAMSTSQMKANLSGEWNGLVAKAQVSSQASWSEVDQSWSESRETFLVSVGPGSQEINLQAFLSPSQGTWLGDDFPDIIGVWQASVNDQPGPVGTTLDEITKPIGAVDGVSSAKVQQVRSALKIYGQTHIHVVTATTDEYNAGSSTTVIVDGVQIDFENEPSDSALCGLLAVVLDRSTLETRLAKFYEPSEVNNNTILNWDFQNDFRSDVTTATTANPSFIIVVATYGMDAVQACPANGHRSFGQAMQTWGGGAGLESWTDQGPSGFVTPPSGESAVFGYILIGANDLENGVEAYVDGGVAQGQSFLARADAQLRPGATSDGTKMIYTPTSY